MAEYRYIHTRFWEDPDMLELSRDEKYFYLYLLTNPKSSQCGISEFPLKIVKAHTGFSEEELLKMIDVFENRLKKIRYNPETKEIAIKNSGKYNYLANNAKVKKHINSEFKKVKDVSLVKYVKQHFTNSKEADIPEEKDEDKKEQKKEYEEGVFLKDIEYEKLVNELGEKPTQEYIKDLSIYMRSRGRRYKSHYATILAWHRKHAREAQAKSGDNEGSGYEKYHSKKKLTKEELKKSKKTGLAEIKKTLEKLKHQPGPESKGKGKMPMKDESENS